MTNLPLTDIFELAAQLGIPVPEDCQASVAKALASLLEQATLVMSAPLPEGTDGTADFAP